MTENKPRFIQESNGAVYFGATEQEALRIAKLGKGFVTKEAYELWRIIPSALTPREIVFKIMEVLDRE